MTHQVTIADNGQTIFVSPGDLIELRLAENPTTGYLWTMEDAAPFLSIQSVEFIRNTDGGIGSSGTRLFRLLVEQGGSREIHLKHGQPWTRIADKTFSLTIQSVG